MGRKQNKKANQSIPEPQPEEEQLQSYPEMDEDELLAADQSQGQQMLKSQNQVMSIIESLMGKGKKEERLTWQSLFSLKKKQMNLTLQMIEEINDIKDKFDLLKQSIYQDVGRVATGKPVDEKLYKLEENPAPEKVSAPGLPQFWSTVFQKSGLIQEQQDIEAFNHLSDFQCKLLSPQTNEIKMTFTFSTEPSLFSNKKLMIHKKEEEDSAEILNKTKIHFKGDNHQNSIFYSLFCSEQQNDGAIQLVNQFYRDYCNATYFFMRDHQEEVDQDLPQQKSSKKTKKEVQKPDCKNQ